MSTGKQSISFLRSNKENSDLLKMLLLAALPIEGRERDDLFKMLSLKP